MGPCPDKLNLPVMSSMENAFQQLKCLAARWTSAGYGDLGLLWRGVCTTSCTAWGRSFTKLMVLPQNSLVSYEGTYVNLFAYLIR